MNKLLTLPFKLAPQNKLFYALFWIIWCITLWFLSSREPNSNPTFEIPHLDKVLHFSYFACGAILVASFLIHQKQNKNHLAHVLIICFMIGAIIGALDEYHQSWVEGRRGNDLWDWVADCIGSIAGSLYCYWGWKGINRTSLKST